MHMQKVHGTQTSSPPPKPSPPPPHTHTSSSILGYFFSSKMSRLIILMGPIASILSGIALAAAVDWSLAQRSILFGSKAQVGGESTYNRCGGGHMQ